MTHHLRAYMLLLMLASAATAGSIEQADGLYHAEKWGESRTAYEAVMPTLSPAARARALTHIGYAWQCDQRMQNAIEHYQAALAIPEIDPTDASFARLQAGTAYTRLGKQQEAVDQLQQVPAIQGAAPNDLAESYIVISSPLIKLDRIDEAIAALKKVEHVQDCRTYYRADSYLRLGGIHQRANRYADAIEAYKVVLTDAGATNHQKEYARGYIDELQTLLQGDIHFYIQPYVTDVRADCAKVSWVSQGGLKSASIEIDESAQSMTIESAALPATACFLHIARLKSLEPGRRYHYTIHAGDEQRKGSFMTCATDDRPVTFAVLGDTQAAPDLHRAVAEAIMKDKPDFVFHVGDLTDRGSTWGKWRTEFFDPGLPYMQYAGIVPAVGNHDGGPYFPALFELNKRMYYSFTHGNVHVAVLDSYWKGTSRRGGGRAAQLKWLEEDLSSTSATWKFVVLHVPMIATHRDVKWFGEDDFRPLCEKYGVDLVLSVHHPMYRKYLPIGPTGHKPILHVTTGGGGPVSQPIPSPIVDVARGVQHHSFITVHGDRLELVSRLPNGAVIDQFELIKHDNAFQQTVMDSTVDPSLAKLIRHLYQELLADDERTLVVDVQGDLKPNQPATLIVDTDALPRGALDRSSLPDGIELIVAQHPGSRWLIEPQARPLANGRMAFTVTPPSDLSIGAARFEPRLDATINFRLAGRLFKPVDCTIAPSEAATDRLAAGGMGLPASWEFRLDPDGVGDRETWFLGDTDPTLWRKLLLTSWWEKQIDKDFDGIAWYRTHARLDPALPGQRLWLVFGAIDESCWLYVNGKIVGEQIYNSKEEDDAWQKPRRFDITDYVQSGDNVLAVKVRDLFGMGGIYRGAALRRAEANRLTFDKSPQSWDHSGAVTLANGMYVGEKALCIEHRGSEPTIFSRDLPVDVVPGDYHLAIRYRLQRFSAGEGETARIAVRMNNDQAEFVAKETRNWQTDSLRITITKSNNVANVQITMPSEGLLTIDEILLQPAETP